MSITEVPTFIASDAEEGSMELNMIKAICKSWIDLIIEFLEEEKQLEDASEAIKLRLKTSWYTMKEGKLFRRSFDGTLCKCVREED